jgi:hypothetical protein
MCACVGQLAVYESATRSRALDVPSASTSTSSEDSSAFVPFENPRSGGARLSVRAVIPVAFGSYKAAYHARFAPQTRVGDTTVVSVDWIDLEGGVRERKVTYEFDSSHFMTKAFGNRGVMRARVLERPDLLRVSQINETGPITLIVYHCSRHIHTHTRSR